MKMVLGMLIILATANVATATPQLISQPVSAEVQAYLEGQVPEPPYAPQVVNRNYDNWSNPPSALTGLFVAGSDEIADDLNMTPVGAGWLDNMGLNGANVNAPSALTGGTISVRFYTLPGGAFISGFNANLPPVSIPAGGSTRLQFAAGALSGLNIYLPQNVYVSLQWAAATFAGEGSVANLGFQTRGPIGIGSSADQLINVTANSTFNFAGNPVANTGLFIDTNDTRTPAVSNTWGGVKALYR